MDYKALAKSVTLDCTIDQKHGYIAFWDGKPMISSDGKMFYDKKATCESNFRWYLQRQLYFKMVDENLVPQSQYSYNLGNLMGFWEFKSTEEFQRAYKELRKELTSTKRYEVKYL